MAIHDAAVIAQIDALLSEIEPKIDRNSVLGTTYEAADPQPREMRTRALAAIERLSPPGSAYIQEARGVAQTKGRADGYLVVRLAGILRALRADVQAGYMRTVEEIVHAGVFADFIEMAEDLVGKGYKDASAVIAGSTLEEHLRKLAGKHSITTERSGRPVKADTLNAALVKAGAYNKLVQKQVTAWLDLRNKAAHGHYDEYDRAQVEAMIRDVRSFIERHPA